MQLTKTHKIIISAIVVALLLLIYISFDRKFRTDGDNTEPVATTTNDGNENVITNPDGTTYTMEKIPSQNKTIPKPIPDLNRGIITSPLATVSEKDVEMATAKVKAFQALLKNDPTQIPVWLDLAMYQKIGGDYEGAIISWKYAALLDPLGFVALGNIGNTYAYYLKDNAQAEIYYKKAIANGKKEAYLYYQLASIYQDIFKDLTKTRAILNEGLKNIPNEPSLLQFRDSLN